MQNVFVRGDFFVLSKIYQSKVMSLIDLRFVTWTIPVQELIWAYYTSRRIYIIGSFKFNIGNGIAKGIHGPYVLTFRVFLAFFPFHWCFKYSPADRDSDCSFSFNRAYLFWALSIWLSPKQSSPYIWADWRISCGSWSSWVAFSMSQNSRSTGTRSSELIEILSSFSYVAVNLLTLLLSLRFDPTLGRVITFVGSDSTSVVAVVFDFFLVFFDVDRDNCSWDSESSFWWSTDNLVWLRKC